MLFRSVSLVSRSSKVSFCCRVWLISFWRRSFFSFRLNMTADASRARMVRDSAARMAMSTGDSVCMGGSFHLCCGICGCVFKRGMAEDPVSSSKGTRLWILLDFYFFDLTPFPIVFCFSYFLVSTDFYIIGIFAFAICGKPRGLVLFQGPLNCPFFEILSL